MRLRKIKLSGFKSFVDPTTLTIPGNLVGVVGPNGCGKSNIIDAVTWVMGESSAKHLRGEALTDVIFNGSSARNPVGQATVELLFDNSENKIGGQFASYNEISVKRQINREGQSVYYLNGARCRRRDITAIFLGTGLGPRSYAIIEQGMISRLIEAKPDELRTYIEEAAGISKYRERRRETENRIRHTKENISRLNDIREELDKQLSHLKRQARAAERYQVLKKEQRQLEAELQALKWMKLDETASKQKTEAQAQETRVESAIADIRKVEKDTEVLRDDLVKANETFNQAQSAYYQIGGEISQLEQKVQHTHERINGLKQDKSQLEAELQQVLSQKQDDAAQLEELEKKACMLEPELKGSRGKSDNAYQHLNDAEQAMQSWQTEWDRFNDAATEYARKDELQRSRINHLEFSIDETRQKITSLEQELAGIDLNCIEQDNTASQSELESVEQQIKEIKNRSENTVSRLSKEKNKLSTLTEKLNAQKMQQHNLEGRLDSLNALQQSASLDDDVAMEWLQQSGLSADLRMAKQIEVDPEWTHAVEMVLDAHLQDICVKDIGGFDKALESLDKVKLGLVSPGGCNHSSRRNDLASLANKVTSNYPVRNLLETVYIAEDAAAALKLRPSLSQHESVITRDGFWASSYWIKVSRSQDAENGMLSREQEIANLQRALLKVTDQIKTLEEKVNAAEVNTTTLDDEVNMLQLELTQLQEKSSEYRATCAAIDGKLSQAKLRAEKINNELLYLNDQLNEDKVALQNLNEALEQHEHDHRDINTQREELVKLKETYRASLEQARNSWTQTHELSHGIALQLEAISSQKASLEHSIKRNALQVSHLTHRREMLDKNMQEAEQPLGEMKARIEQKLAEKIDAEKQLTATRLRVQEIENTIREQEQKRIQHEQEVQGLRDTLEKARMLVNESQVRLQTIEEQLKTSGLDIREIVTSLDQDAEQQAWEENLESVCRKINRLGPINLAAIDEYNQLTERKEYMDSQFNDLTSALTTLENAIQKIDKESRTRFRDTFDRLNNNLQETFPILFGGGRASLELTGNDLLETGVTIMARPPGKRNSSIHLLSGGEKALTAVALVFSIFKLNPAPFCILDEVDAPLDDANVSRFSEMLSSMSEDVQFLFITHNKITMEIASQLLGVTMQEAGVSRLVSVDVDEAVEMAATA